MSRLAEQPFGVVAFRKTDGGRDLACQLVLLQQPWAGEIPPFGAVEYEIEPGRGGLLGLFRRAAQCFRDKQGIRMGAFDTLDQAAPEMLWNLIGGIAAKAGEPESH